MDDLLKGCATDIESHFDFHLLSRTSLICSWRVLVNKWAVLVWHWWSLTFICSNRQVGCVWNIELMAPLWVRLTAIATVMTIGMAVSWWTCNPMIGLCRG